MPHPDYTHCRECGGHKEDVGSLSWTRLCARCATERAAANVRDMSAHSGPNFAAWRRAMAASVGGVLLDELPDGD